MENTSQLGFGILRLPGYGKKAEDIDWTKAEEIITEYMKGEFCYFDLHPQYMCGKAQDILRELVVKKYPREAYGVANKMPYYGIDSYRDYEVTFAAELSACEVEWFDYYMLHAVIRDVYEMHEKYGGFTFLEKKKKEGKIRYMGLSFHDSPELLEEILETHPEIDFVQLQINFLDWESPLICSRRCYEIARKYKKQIIVMEPIKGGILTNPVTLDDKPLSSGELARISLEFVATLPGIHIVLSGMSEVKQVWENRNTLSNPVKSVDDTVYQKLVKQISAANKIPCTACRYCMRECPENIRIPDIIALLNDYRETGGSLQMYRGLVHGNGKAGDCISCGKCEQKCPQKLKIRTYMKKAWRIFEGSENQVNYYTSERNTQILIYLMKAHGIKKIVISPGATNICLVWSVQQDGDFEIYSAADERSAAYMACGLAAESGEPVALSCTGATASRNYMPALTEAYYRKLPVLAITSTQPEGRIGNNFPQVIDRRNSPNDIVKMSVNIPNIHDAEEEWTCEVRINQALLELKRGGGGPVHINLATKYSRDFSVRKLPSARVIRRVMKTDRFPDIPDGKIGIFVGAHEKWNDELTSCVDRFCEQYGGVVICDHTSNYRGKYGVLAGLVFAQENRNPAGHIFDLIIDLGNVSGAYFDLQMMQVWRVNPDGEIRDRFRKLNYVFEMDEVDFFAKYTAAGVEPDSKNTGASLDFWNREYERLYQKMPELPFSNAWIAKQTAPLLPPDCVLHLGIKNTLQCWNFFEVPVGVNVYANTGGFGIDGCVSSLIGASLAEPEKLFIGVVGDLAFFYDMNVLGNRHLGANVRIILVNNGCGTSLKFDTQEETTMREEIDAYIAAAGHYGNKSKELVKNYAQNLGFDYFGAADKEEYLKILPVFLNPEITERPMLLEVFTDSREESRALKMINTLDGEKKTGDVDKKAVVPARLCENAAKLTVVLWGAGRRLTGNLSKIESFCKVSCVCDNNSANWGKELVPGITCISPEQLSKMEDVFVVIMPKDSKVAFQIISQLLDIGINNFDILDNWLEYAANVEFKS